MPRSFIHNEEAVSTEIGHILSLVVLMIFTISIAGVFYEYADSSSIKSMRIGFTDLGSQLARDITNMYFISQDSPNRITLNITRDIPLTMGGRGYSINLTNSEGLVSIDLKDGSFYSNSVGTAINSINTNDVNKVDISRSKVVYSGSGTINIRMEKNNTGTIKLWIE